MIARKKMSKTKVIALVIGVLVLGVTGKKGNEIVRLSPDPYLTQVYIFREHLRSTWP